MCRMNSGQESSVFQLLCTFCTQIIYCGHESLHNKWLFSKCCIIVQCFPGCLTIQIRTVLCIFIVVLIYSVAQGYVVSISAWQKGYAWQKQ